MAVRRNDQRQLIGSVRLDQDLRIAYRAFDQRDGEAARVDGLDDRGRVGDVQADGRGRMRLAERGNRRQHGVVADRHRDADVERAEARAGELAHLALERVGGGQQIDRALREERAGVGEDRAAADHVEERRAEVVGERAHCCVTAGCESASSSAVRVKLPISARRANVCSCVRVSGIVRASAGGV